MPIKKLLPSVPPSSLCAAFFVTISKNFVDLGFRDHRGYPITSLITVDPNTHRTGIAFYFVFWSTVDPATIDPRITKTSITIEFWLVLPQTILNAAPTTDHARRNLQTKFESTPAPIPQTSPTPHLKMSFDAS